MAKTWADFVPEIAMYVADCPHFTIEDAAKTATIDYFRESRIWRSTAPVMIATSVAGQSTYAVTNTAGQEIAGLVTVWQDDKEIPAAVPGQARDYDLGKTGPVRFAMLIDGATVQLLPAPDTAGRVIKAVVAYAPTDAATGLSDSLFSRYARSVRDLAIANLKRMQGKPWHDPAGAREAAWAGGDATLYDSTGMGPTARNRLRTKKSVI